MPSIPYQSLLPYLLGGSMPQDQARPGLPGFPPPPSGSAGSPMQQPPHNSPRPMMRGMPPQEGGYYPQDPVTLALSNPHGGQPPEQVGGPMMPQPNFAAASQVGDDGVDPLAPTKKPGAFGKGGIGWTLLGILGDGMSAYGGQQGTFGPSMQRKAEADNERNWAREKLNAEFEAKRQERMSPRVEQVGNTIGYLDPSAGKYNPFFTAPGPSEQYAAARGFAPGTPEYQSEVQNYRLGTWSDPAMENRSELDEQRFGQRRELLDDRLEVTRRGQDMTDARQRRGQTLTDGRGRRGQDMTDGRVRDSAGFKGKPGRGSSGGAEPFAISADGHKIVVRNGKWVDAATGKPVQ